jgi:hypothetical protein
MSQNISLKEAERKVFATAFQDGLWDILLGCFVLLFAVGPFLTATALGDFWGSVIFLPFWALTCLAIWLLRRFVVTPRIGVVRYGPVRKTKLAAFTVVMLVVNVVALVLGLVAAASFARVPGQIFSIGFGLILMIGISMAAYLLDFRRLYVYGLLIGLSPLVGEWLYLHAHAAHHGFPITFGVTAGIILLVGAIKFVLLLRDHPIAADEPSPVES